MLKINFNFLFLFIFSLLISSSSFAKDPDPEPVTWNPDLKELVFGDDIIKDGSALFLLIRHIERSMQPLYLYQ